MEFVETRVFTERIVQLLTDEAYQALQWVLAEHPKAGEVIPGAGGLRKLRFGCTCSLSMTRPGKAI